MMRTERIEGRASLAAIALALCLTSGRGTALEPPGLQETDTEATRAEGSQEPLLDASLREQVADVLARRVAPDGVRPLAMELYDASIAAHGDLEYLFEHLEAKGGEGVADGPRHLVRRLLVVPAVLLVLVMIAGEATPTPTRKR